MFEEEEINRILSYEKTILNWRNDYTSKEWNESSKMNNKLFGMPFNRSANCHCVEDFFRMFKYYVKNDKIKEIMEKKFVLKKGIMLMNHNFQQPITNISSDEDCIKLLRLNKNHAKNFELLPDNWEDIVNGKVTEEVKKVKIKAKRQNN